MGITCASPTSGTGLPDLIDQGCFKFACRNLVWLQVQVDIEVNSNLSQVPVEERSGSRPGHGPFTENDGKIVLKKSYWAVPMDPPLRQPARSVGWPLLPRPAQNLKLQGNEYFQWKQRVLRSNLVRIINLHVRFSFSMYFAKFVNDYCRNALLERSI